MMKTKQEQEVAYVEYLDSHRKYVKRAWNLIKQSSTNTEWYNDMFVLISVNYNVPLHDLSKYSAEEFEQYRQWYYPMEDEIRDEELFNQAWNHHKEVNLHHWESMQNISNKRDKLAFTLELIADWMSVGYMKNEGVMDYYDKNKDKVILEDWQHELISNTYELIGEYLGKNNISFKEYMER